ncbi:hypothetical protein D3C78_1478330 [compost metagenome]
MVRHFMSFACLQVLVIKSRAKLADRIGWLGFYQAFNEPDALLHLVLLKLLDLRIMDKVNKRPLLRTLLILIPYKGHRLLTIYVKGRQQRFYRIEISAVKHKPQMG